MHKNIKEKNTFPENIDIPGEENVSWGGGSVQRGGAVCAKHVEHNTTCELYADYELMRTRPQLTADWAAEQLSTAGVLVASSQLISS